MASNNNHEPKPTAYEIWKSRDEVLHPDRSNDEMTLRLYCVHKQHLIDNQQFVVNIHAKQETHFDKLHDVTAKKESLTETLQEVRDVLCGLLEKCEENNEASDEKNLKLIEIFNSTILKCDEKLRPETPVAAKYGKMSEYLLVQKEKHANSRCLAGAVLGSLERTDDDYSSYFPEELMKSRGKYCTPSQAYEKSLKIPETTTTQVPLPDIIDNIEIITRKRGIALRNLALNNLPNKKRKLANGFVPISTNPNRNSSKDDDNHDDDDDSDEMGGAIAL